MKTEKWVLECDGKEIDSVEGIRFDDEEEASAYLLPPGHDKNQEGEWYEEGYVYEHEGKWYTISQYIVELVPDISKKYILLPDDEENPPSTIFEWNQEIEGSDGDVLEWETIAVSEAHVSGKQLQNFEKSGSIETYYWKGTVVHACTKNTGEYDTSEPAYGGESNTDGIPEKGALYIDAEMLSGFLCFEE